MGVQNNFIRNFWLIFGKRLGEIEEVESGLGKRIWGKRMKGTTSLNLTWADEDFKKLRKEVGRFEIVSYFYPVPKIKPAKTLRGINKIFVYKR